MVRRLLGFCLVLILPYTSVHAQNDTPHISRDTSRLGTFINKLLSAQLLEGSAKAQVIRKSFAETPEIILWLLDEKELQKSIDESPMARMDTDGQLSHRLHLWIQKQVGDELSEVLLELRNRYDPKGEAPKKISEILSNFSVEERLELLSAVPDESWSRIDQELGKILSQVKIGDMDFLKTMSQAALGDEIPKAMKSLFESILGKYFDSLPPAFRVPLFIGFFEVPKDSPWTQLVGVLLKKSGVVFQKIAQLLGRDAKDPKLKEILNLAQNELEPALTFDEAKKIFELEYRVKLDEVFSSFDPVPVAVASTGQVHRAVLKESGKSVVIKFRKPNILNLAKMEIDTIRSIAGTDPAVVELISRFESKLLEELNYKNEAFFTDLFEKIYEIEGKPIQTIKRVKVLHPAEHLSITYFSSGKKVTKYKDEKSLKIRARALKELTAWWFEVAMFSPDRVNEALIEVDGEWGEYLKENPKLLPKSTGLTGFHGDLHPGNLFMSISDDENDPFQITLLDFGNVAFLTASQRKAFMTLFLATLSSSESRVMSALAFISKFDKSLEPKLLESIQLVFKKHSDPMARMGHILRKSLELGVEIPDDFYSFIRGRAMLEGEINEINDLLGANSPNRIDTMKIYRDIALKKIFSLSGMARKIYDKSYREAGAVNPRLIFEFIYDYSEKWISSLFSCKDHLLIEQNLSEQP